MTKLQLPSGVSYFTNDKGERICTGAMMGRQNVLPQNPDAPIKLRLEKLPLVDGDYDKKGAYWGYTPGTNIYCAWSGDTRIFVRAESRQAAKSAVWGSLPFAHFYR